MPQFTNVIANEAALRDVIAEPRGSGAWDKSLSFIDPHAAAFISRSPFCMIATVDAAGRMDISPKGDPAGFVRVLDEHTIAIPDRPGNGRADTFRNVLANPRISVYFMVPTRTESLRINGSAKLVTDQWLLDEMSVKERPAQLALVISVEEAFFHCAKCVVRSNLWDADGWVDASDLAPLGTVMRDQLKLEVPAEAIQAGLDKDVERRLY
ncbi:MAG: MSMEG_1061 family FMN-dependent PPOX-type flavoprotein [Dehalococcoidia bacterium]|jgi:PPOX class probable FMN-dependent enzyme